MGWQVRWVYFIFNICAETFAEHLVRLTNSVSYTRTHAILITCLQRTTFHPKQYCPHIAGVLSWQILYNMKQKLRFCPLVNRPSMAGGRQSRSLKTGWLVVGVLHPCNIWGHTNMGTILRLCALMVTAPLGNQAAGIMTCYLTQLHYPGTELNQSLHYLINAVCQAWKRHVSIFISH